MFDEGVEAERRSSIQDRIESATRQPACGCHVVWELVWMVGHEWPADVIVREFVGCCDHYGNELHSQTMSARLRLSALEELEHIVAGRPDYGAQRIDVARALRMLAFMQSETKGTLALSPRTDAVGDGWDVIDVSNLIAAPGTIEALPWVVFRDRHPVLAVVGAAKLLRIDVFQVE